MERDDLELLLAAAAVVDAPDAAAVVVDAPDAAAAVVVDAPEAAADAVAVASEAAAVLVAASEAAPASSADDDDEGALELLAEVLEKTKTMKLTEQAVTSLDVGAAAAASVENKEDGGRRRHQMYHEESANSKVPVPASIVAAQTTNKKKLLVLDLNGLLADINQDFRNASLSDGRCRGKLVFKRPFCNDFLEFCFDNFDVGVWSSRLRVNVDAAVDILMKDFKHRLLFSWDASMCTATGLSTLENKNKPLVLKELKKLWSKEDGDDGLPWKQGEFSPTNTLLVDDSPYKALRNPPHTAIFPCSYSYKNKDDSSLGPGGDLRLYLESLATADDVQRFVREHPFGQPAITESDSNWNFYKQVLLE